jgi:predicted AlkP superfamily pyrophosphatase or phosphodiesterase
MTYEEFSSNQIRSKDAKNSVNAQQQEYVILISIDGFRHDYAEKYGAKNLLSLAENGSSTKRLIPSYPSKTFPNHYTLVTGLYPAHHGLVSNEFYSRAKNARYKISDKAAVRDSSWYTGVPLWTLADQSEMLSGSVFWVGSEVIQKEGQPTYYYEYNGAVPNSFRFRKVKDWLMLEPEIRPHFISTYFSLVDDAGHSFGPEHERTKAAVLEIDRLLGLFLEEIDSLDLPVNIIVVSDHGMVDVNRGIVLPELVDLEDAKITYSMPTMIYQPDSIKRQKLLYQLQQNESIDTYTRESLPLYLNLQNKDRLGDIMLQTDPPTVIIDRPKVVKGGTHGFDPFKCEEMGAIFYIKGPRIKSGYRLPPLENVHIYPLITELLGLSYDHSIDGQASFTKDVLK